MKYFLILLILLVTSCSSVEWSEKGPMTCRTVKQGDSGQCIYHFSNGYHGTDLAFPCTRYSVGDTLQ